MQQEKSSTLWILLNPLSVSSRFERLSELKEQCFDKGLEDQVLHLRRSRYTSHYDHIGEPKSLGRRQRHIPTHLGLSPCSAPLDL